MKKMNVLLMAVLLLTGCYWLGRQFPLWDVRTVNPPSAASEILPERIDGFERRMSLADIWTQC